MTDTRNLPAYKQLIAVILSHQDAILYSNEKEVGNFSEFADSDSTKSRYAKAVVNCISQNPLTEEYLLSRLNEEYEDISVVRTNGLCETLIIAITQWQDGLYKNLLIRANDNERADSAVDSDLTKAEFLLARVCDSIQGPLYDKELLEKIDANNSLSYLKDAKYKPIKFKTKRFIAAINLSREEQLQFVSGLLDDPFFKPEDVDDIFSDAIGFSWQISGYTKRSFHLALVIVSLPKLDSWIKGKVTPLLPLARRAFVSAAIKIALKANGWITEPPRSQNPAGGATISPIHPDGP